MVNQSVPFGPDVICAGLLMPLCEKIVTLPVVAIRPTESPKKFVNQRAPSDPTVIPSGPSIPAPLKLVITPDVVIRPIELLP